MKLDYDGFRCGYVYLVEDVVTPVKTLEVFTLDNVLICVDVEVSTGRVVGVEILT